MCKVFNTQKAKRDFSLLFVLMAFTLACGKNQGNKGTASSQTFTESPEQIIQLLPQTNIDTPSSPISKDPQLEIVPGVGSYVYVEPENEGSNLNFCTATLINDQHVITAGHCAPSDLSAEDACKNTYFIHASDKNKLKCSKVLFSTKDLEINFETANGTKNPVVDIMIFQLDRKPIGISSHTISRKFAPKSNNEDPYSVLSYSLKPMNLNAKQSIKELEGLKFLNFSLNFAAFTGCTLQDAFESGHPLRTLSCKIIEGNSGSPVFNSNGDLQGIIGGCVGAVDGVCSNGNKGGYMTDLGCINQNFDGSYSWNPNCPATGVTRIKGV